MTKNQKTAKTPKPVTFNGLYPCESDAIALFSYALDSKSHTGDLLLVFRDSGHMYVYSEVEAVVFAQFMNSRSKGGFHSGELKPHYPCRRVDSTVTITL
jgi:hypothetical protein